MSQDFICLRIPEKRKINNRQPVLRTSPSIPLGFLKIVLKGLSLLQHLDIRCLLHLSYYHHRSHSNKWTTGSGDKPHGESAWLQIKLVRDKGHEAFKINSSYPWWNMLVISYNDTLYYRQWRSSYVHSHHARYQRDRELQQTCKGTAEAEDVLGSAVSWPCLNEMGTSEDSFLVGWYLNFNCNLLLLWLGQWQFFSSVW